MAGRGHNGHRWRQRRARVLEGNPICGICHRPIDKALRYPDPWSASVDMIQPWSLGGDPADMDNLRPAHRFCNTSRGNGKRRQQLVRGWIAEGTP